MRRIARTFVWAWLCVHTGIATTLAWAHAFPERSQPRVGSTVDASPAEVRIWFDGLLEPLFSTIQVLDEQDKRVDTENGGVDARDRHQLAVGLALLAPGRYTVRWDVVAVDGHRTEGRFAFTIRGGP